MQTNSSSNSVALHHKIYGDSDQSIVVLHGLFGCLDNWHTQAKQLAKKFHVVTVDQRNHGRSPHTDEFGYLEMAQDLKVLIENQKLKKIHLIGHSMGGKTAMHFALAYSEMVDHLIVVDMAPKPYPPQHNEIFDILESTPLETFSVRQEIDEALKEKIPENSLRLFLMKNLTRDHSGNFVWKINLPVLRKSYETLNAGLPQQETFNGSTLFLRGEYSNYILDEDEELIKSIFPQSKIETIKNAGHWIHAQAPEEFAQAINKFLE